MNDKKHSPKKMDETTEEMRRIKKQKRLRQMNKEESHFEEALEELLEDEEVYHLLKKLKD